MINCNQRRNVAFVYKKHYRCSNNPNYITYYESKQSKMHQNMLLPSIINLKSNETIKVCRKRNIELKVSSFKIKSDLKIKIKDE